jgi:uncharacterized protein (TIGR00369 family)
MNLEQLNSICKGTLMEHLGIEFTEVSEHKIVARMPVDRRTFQPAGRLHGGASAALAESIGSAGSLTLVDTEKYSVLGVDLNATHLAATHQAEVFGTGKIIHKGRTQHVWEIKIEDKTGKLISVCRLTNRIIPK